MSDIPVLLDLSPVLTPWGLLNLWWKVHRGCRLLTGPGKPTANVQLGLLGLCLGLDLRGTIGDFQMQSQQVLKRLLSLGA